MLFGKSTPPEAMGHLTGFLLNWVATRSRTTFAQALSEHGITPQQYGALTVIQASPGMAQQELVAATNIDPSTMVAMLDALGEAGLAERRPHASDRRKHALHLTAKGERTMTAAQSAGQQTMQEVFGVLDDDERAELHRLLRKVAGYAD